MADSETYTFPLTNKGVCTKVEPRLLTDGQLQRADNITSLQEGSISTRSGSLFKGNLPALANTPHTIRKLRVSDDDSLNYRYVGEGQDIYRTLNYSDGTYTKVATGIVEAADAVSKRWNMAAYSAGSSYGSVEILYDNHGRHLPPGGWPGLWVFSRGSALHAQRLELAWTEASTSCTIP